MQTAHPFYTRLWRENRVLLERVAVFYREFGALVPDLALSPQGRRARQMGGTTALSAYESLCLAPEIGIDGRRGEDFSPPPARVALLPLPELRHLTALAGVTLLRQDITRAVARHEVQAVRERAGEEAHLFALTRAATYEGHAERVRRELQRPEVLDPERALQWDEEPLPQRIMALGGWCLGACVAAGGASLLARVRALLPESGAGPLAPEAENAAWPLIRVLIFKEIPCQWEDGWQSFFA